MEGAGAVGSTRNVSQPLKRLDESVGHILTPVLFQTLWTFLVNGTTASAKGDICS